MSLTDPIDTDLFLPSPGESAADREMELILEKGVTASDPVWAEGLTARVMAARPFAPWEVRRARAWRAPALAAGGLLAASLGVFLAPLWSLGPATALETWARVMAAGSAAGLPALIAALPTLVSAAGSVLSGTPGIRPALGAGLLASAAGFATVAGLARRPALRSSRLSRAGAAASRS